MCCRGLEQIRLVGFPSLEDLRHRGAFGVPGADRRGSGFPASFRERDTVHKKKKKKRESKAQMLSTLKPPLGYPSLFWASVGIGEGF